MASYTQANRPLALTTPLGPDALLLEQLTGTEALSELFHFRVHLLAERRVDFSAVLDYPATVTIDLPNGCRRFVHGIVNRLAQGGTVPGPDGPDTFIRYRAELVPALWRLTRRVQSRVFQQVSVPELLREVLHDEWQLDVTFVITSRPPPRNYCVQYQESDFAFVSRLMEEEGLCYYFEHRADGHTLVVTDAAGPHPDLPEPGALAYDPRRGGLRDGPRVWEWEKVQEVRASQYALADYHFEVPHNDLSATHLTPDEIQAGRVTHHLRHSHRPGQSELLELFDYPGGFAHHFDAVDPGGGERARDMEKVFEENQRVARLRAEAEASQALQVRGTSDGAHLAAGYRLTLAGHFDADGPYLLTWVEHRAGLGGAYTTDPSAAPVYENTFQGIPAGLPFRPPRRTPRPRIDGTQTAVVTGPRGDAVFVDPHGRVKVKFRWDRRAAADADSSCWVRVAQFWAGKHWGAFFWPRVGQEVVVAFEDGDPDRPLVVGSLYNAENRPPLELPRLALLNGVKSCTAHGNPAVAFNGVVFNDMRHGEALTLHSHRDIFLNSDRNTVFNTGGHLHTDPHKTRIQTNGCLPMISVGAGGNGDGDGSGSPADKPPAPAARPGARSEKPAHETHEGQEGHQGHEGNEGHGGQGGHEPHESQESSDEDTDVPTWDEEHHWNTEEKEEEEPHYLGPTVAWETTYGLEGAALFGFGTEFVFGLEWKDVINPLGVVHQLADAAPPLHAVEAVLAPVEAALGGYEFAHLGADLQFTVGSSVRYLFGPSMSFTHGNWYSFIPVKGVSHTMMPALKWIERACRLTALAISLLEAAATVAWGLAKQEKEAKSWQKELGIGLTLPAAVVAKGILVSLENVYFSLASNRDSAAAIKANVRKMQAAVLNGGNFLDAVKAGLKYEKGNILQRLKDLREVVTAETEDALPRVETITDGAWITRGSRCALEAYGAGEDADTLPRITISATTDFGPGGFDPVRARGAVDVMGDHSVFISGGKGGVVIQNVSTPGALAPIKVGGLGDVVEIGYEGLAKIVVEPDPLFAGITLKALNAITLQVGASSIRIDQTGIRMRGLIRDDKGHLVTLTQ